MKLNITQKIENEKKEIFASFAKNQLKITEDSENWNSQGINDFLIKLATNVPEEEQIELEYDQKNDNEIYKQIVNLFQKFVDQYNDSIKNS